MENFFNIILSISKNVFSYVGRGIHRKIQKAFFVFSILIFILFNMTCSLVEPGTGDKVDVTPPEVEITSPAQNTYVRGSFILSGTVNDDRSLKSIVVSYQGDSAAVTKTVVETDGKWNLSIPTGTTSADNLVEGRQTITVVVTDDSDKTAEVFLMVIVDNIAPTVLVTVPQGYGSSISIVSDYIDIKGEVWDPSPIVSVSVSLVGISGSKQLCNGTYTWSTRVNVTTLSDLTTFNYMVEAVDSAGNTNIYYYHSQDVWDLLPVDTLFPSMDEIGNLDQEHITTSSGIIYGSLYARRLGTSVEVYGDFYKNNDATLPVINFTNLDTALPITSNLLGTQVPINGYVNPGPANNPVDHTSFEAWIIPAADYPTWPATSNVDSGDITTIFIGSSISYQIVPKVNSSYISSGQYYVKVGVSAQGSVAVATLTCGFLVDAGAPHIESTVPENNTLVSYKIFEAGTPLEGQTGVEILVEAIDDNSIQSFTATASLTEGGATLPGVTSAATTGDWYIVQVPLLPGQENIWFEIDVTDDAGSTAHESLHFAIDEIIPAVTINSPVPGAWVTGNSTTISGTSSDNTGQVENIFIWLGLTTDTPPADVTTWNSLPGNASWATTVPLVAGEGEYTIYAVAVDFAGNHSIVANRNFFLDQSNPTLTETSIGGTTAYKNLPFTLSGTASDTNAVAHITVSQILNGGAPSLVVDQDITGQNYNWSYILPGGSLEGTYEYTITLTDAAGKSASPINRTVIFDETLPLVNIIAIAPMIGTNSVNGIISYSAYASDVNGITAVRRWVLLSTDPAPAWDTVGFTVWASPYSATLDTTDGLTDGEEYIICVKALDAAGNVNSVSRTITIDQSSDMPALILSNLDETKNTPALGWDNLLESNAKIQGSITDDDMVDASSIEISIDSNSAWTAVTQKGPNGKSVSFEHNLTTPVELPEGSHYFYIRSSDLASAKSGLAAVNVTLGPVYFVIDKNPPSIAITLPAQDSVQSGSFTISGTASDANGLADLDTDTLADIEISTDGGTIWSILAADGGTWTYNVTIDTVGHTDDGIHTYKFRATDSFGKTQTLDLRFTVDTSGPTLTMIAPSAASWLSGSTYLASGTSSDGTGTGVKQVYWWVGALADTPPGAIGSWNIATGTTFWSGLMDLTTLGEGDKRLHIQAEDMGGIFSSIMTRDFGVDQADPVLAITNIVTGVVGRNAVFNMTGTADDSNNLASILVEQRKDADPFVTIENIALTGTSDTFDITGLPRDPATPASTLFTDGLFEYRVTITDGAGRVNQATRTVQIDQTPPVAVIINPGPSAWLSGSAFTASGTATDALTGVALVEYSTDGTNWSNATGTASWSTTLDLAAIGEGALTFYVRATDNAGNTSTPVTQSFGIDQSIPDLAETNINQTSAYRNVNYTLSGTASDTNQLLDVAGVDYITLSVNGGAAENIDVAAGSWTYPVTIDTVGHTDDGEYEYIFTATDIAGKYRQVTRTITVDTSPPTAEITTITPVVGSNTVNGIISYGAYASDESGITGVKAWMLLATDPDPVYSTPGQITAWASSPYSGTIDTETLTDLTDYKLWIGVLDKAGNEILVSQVIVVDQSSDNPVVDITNMDETKDTVPEAGDNLQESNAKIQGTITDDDRVDGTTILISIDGGAYGAVSQSGPNGKTVTFEHNVSALAEGIHYYSIQADDLASEKAGKPAVTGTLGPVYFTIDRNPPQIAISSPPQDSILNANFSISGTASDANGLADLDSDTFADIEVSTDGGSNWTILPADGGTWTYNVTIDTVGHTDDGSYTYKLRATDSFNKTTIIDYRFVIDTEAAQTMVSAPAPSSWLSSSPYIVSGTAVDNTGGSGVAQVWTLVDATVTDHSADTSVDITTGGLWEQATGTTMWSHSWDLGTEGQKKLWVASLDNAGNWSTSYLTVVFGFDLSNPSLAETAINTPNIVNRNNTITFSGTASDTNSAAAPTLGVSVDGGVSQAITIIAGNWSYDYIVNSVTHANDGTHTFAFTLTDAAGKTGVVTRNVLVDTQVINPSVTTPSASSWVSTTPFAVSGTAGDNSGGSGVDQIWTLVDDAAVDHSTDTIVSITTGGIWQLAIGRSSWNYIWALGSEGNKTLWVALVDNAGNWTTTYESLSFGYDAANPTLAETAYGTSGTVYDNATLIFSGTATDSNPADSPTLEVRADGGLGEAITITAGSWTYNYPVNTGTHAQDGSHNFVFTLTDASGKTSTANRSVIVDTITPSVQINSVMPILPGNQVNGVVTLSSNISDDNGINGVKYFLRNDASTPVYADGDGTVIPSAPYSAQIDTTLFADDTWTLWVIARDKADNTQSTSAVIDILQSTDYPSAAIDTPADTDPIGADKKIRGTYSDDDGVALTGAILYVRKLGAPSYTSKAINTSSGANQLIAWTVDVADVITAGGDGTYQMYLSVTDNAAQKSGKPAETTDTAVQTFASDTNPPTVSTISITPSQAAYKALDVLTLSWNAIDLLGLAAQNVDVDGSATGLGSITDLGGGDFEITYTVPDSGITSGNKTFTLIAEDNTGHTATKTVTFLVDIDDPVVDNAYTINPSFIGFTPNGQFEIKGTSSDNRGLTSVELQLSGPDGNDGTNWYAATLSSGNWTYNVADSSTYVAASGTLNIKVRATDQAGNISAEREFNQAVDQAADKAVATLISPVDSSTYGTTVQISGTAADDDNMADIDDNLIIDTDAIEIFWDSVPTSGGTTLNPTITGSGKNATFNHALNGLPGGDYIVRVRAKDDASTWGDWSSDVTFTVNAGAPNLTISTSLNAFRSNPSLLLQGSVEDSDGVVDVRVRVNGGSWQTANADSGSWGPSNTIDTWNITLNLGSDGLKTLEIQAQDNSSYVANEQLSTTLDSTSPAGTFDAQFRDDPSGSFLNTTALNKVVRITGTVTELNLADTNPIEISIDGGAYVPVTGTFVWSYVWDTSGLADGDYDLQLRITDKAGNVTDTITKTVTTDQSADIPEITSNFVAAPDTSQAGNNVLSTLLKISGTLTDDDGFNSGAMEIFLDGSPTSIAATNTTGTTVTWEYTWASLAQGEHYLTLRVTDKNGGLYNTAITYFIVDSENPSLTMTTPTAGGKVNAGTLSIVGTAFDAGGLDVDSLTIDLRHSNVSSSLHGVNYTPSVSGGTWSQNVTIDNAVLDGTLYIDLTLTDRAGKEATMTRAVTIDITDPILNLNYPASGAYINGLVYVTGTADDLNGLADVTMEILNPTTKNPVSSITRSSATLAAWEFPFNSFSYTTSTYGIDVHGDGTLWQVFFRLAAHDNSGNITELKVGDPLDWAYFYIDTDGDKPTISVTQPKHGDNIGGIVGMFGTATDDDGPVMQVEVRIDFTGDGDFADTRDINNNDADANPATGIELGVDSDIFGTTVKIGDPDYMWEDESAWYVVDVSNNAWTQELNSNSELYVSNTGGTGEIVIQVRSRDMFGLASEVSERTITLDETFPRIENTLPVDQTYQNGTFNLTVEFGDDIDLDLGSNSQIRININKTGYVTLTQGAYVAGTHPYDLIADLDDPQNGFDLDYPINTDTYFPGSSGILYVDLYVRDEASYINQRSLTFYVDNQPPTTSWSTSITRPDGSNLRNGMITVNAVNKTYIEGNYSDSGSVSGISHIEVFIVKSGTIRNLKSSGTWGGTPATESISVENYNLGTNIWTATTDPAASFVDNASLGDNYVIKIDTPTEMSDLNFGTDTDGDGYHEYLGIYDGAPRWRAYFDSQYIPDGIIDLHYVAYDLAGNREHKMRQVFIANNGPVIDQIRLGSDLNFSSDVADVAGGVTEIQDYYYPGGTVDRTDYQQIKNNKLYFGIYGADPTGTNQGIKQIFIDVYDSTGLTYRGQAHASGLNPTNGDEIVTLDVNPGTAPWVDDGNYNVSPFKVNYLVKITVRDNDDINMTHWVKVSVLNPNDTTSPVITLNPLTQSDQDGSVGHLELQGDNTTGDWDTLTAGYTPDDDDPKASGVIIFKGTVTDENRLTEISVASENNPMPVLASWVGGVLVSNDVSVFTIDSQSLVETGHTVTFTYKWDSSDVTGITGMDKSVTFDAEDGATVPNSAIDQSRQLDVVPYIKTITRQTPLPSNRTKYGKFLVSSGETNITVTGFNLGNGTYTPVVTINRTGGGVQNIITVTGTGTPYDNLTITGTQMVNSGWLEIAVNGQSSVNNLNANTLDSNKDDDGSGISSTLWNDDRYMLVFDIGDYFAGSDAPEWPSMDVNFTTGHIYGSWSSYNTAWSYYSMPNSFGGGATRINDNNYDPSEYTDIKMYDDATDVRHTIVLENENGAGAWQGLRSKINDASGITIEYLGGDYNADTNTNTINHADGKDEMLFQFKNPRIAINPAGVGTNDDVKYVSYYDSWSKCLKYAVITGGTGTFIPHYAHMTDNQVVVDGIDWINSGPDYKYAASENVGLWNDIGIDPDDGVPVIIYYSVTNKTLKIARGWDTQPVGNFDGTAPYAPSGTHEWNITNVRPSNSYLGSYVSMTIDSNPASTTYGDLFIVTFQNATGDLVYIHGHDVDGTGAGINYTFDTPVTIDTDGSVGAWSDISLMYNGTTAVPYVSYLNSSAVGTLEGLKYAWVESGDGSLEDDWEYGIIPSDDPVRDHRTNIVAHSSVNIGRSGGENADVAIGFAGTYFDIVYRTKEQ